LSNFHYDSRMRLSQPAAKSDMLHSRPMKPPSFKNASRDQSSLLAPLEKRLLVWLAYRLPPWVSSDALTLLGFSAMCLAGLSYWVARWNRFALLVVILWLIVNWFGDSLDGTVARVRNKQRPKYGFYVDHITDAFGTFFLLGGLALSGYISRTVGAGLLIAYFLLSIEVYLATYTIGTFHLSHWKFSPTELRILLIAGNITALFRPVVKVFGREFLLFDFGGTIGIIGMGLMVITAAIRHTRALYREERV
jgi:archaetidylinositol phosphate synthase